MDQLVTQAATALLPTKHGHFKIFVFEDNEKVAYSVLTTDKVVDNALVRVHSECETGDIFGSLKCDCGEQLEQSLEMIAKDGNGLFIYMRKHEGRGIGIVNKIRAYALQDQGADTIEANHQLGFKTDLRSYELAAEILQHFQIKNIRLLSNNPDKAQALKNLGIIITEQIPLRIRPNVHNQRYIDTKQKKMGHL
jgi:GTP cyclohydrolase II